MLNFEFRATHDLDAIRLQAVIALKSQHWPYPLQSQQRWFAQHVAAGDRHVLGWADGALRAYLRIVPAKGRQRSASHDLGLVDTVIIDRAQRRKGWGKALVSFANDSLNGEGSIGLLGCEEAVVCFYQLCGWRIFHQPVVFTSDDLAKLVPSRLPTLVLDPTDRLLASALHVSRGVCDAATLA